MRLSSKELRHVADKISARDLQNAVLPTPGSRSHALFFVGGTAPANRSSSIRGRRRIEDFFIPLRQVAADSRQRRFLTRSRGLIMSNWTSLADRGMRIPFP